MQTPLEAAGRYVGKTIRRVEDRRILIGGTRYVDDIQMPKTQYMSVVRSTYPHANLTHVDTDRARRYAGVTDVITYRDIQGHVNPISPYAYPPRSRSVHIHALASKKTRYVGEPIAAILATDRATAEDAVELVEVDYEPLKSISTMKDAMDSSVVLFEEWGDNIMHHAVFSYGDVESALKESDVVVENEFRIPIRYGAPMEPRGCIGIHDVASRSNTLYTSTQWPHVVRSTIAEALGIGENMLRVVAPDVGGGFGVKQDLYHEELLTLILSRRNKVPVKWTPSRSEDFLSSTHAMGQTHEVVAGASREGKILAFKDVIRADIGMPHTLSVAPPTITVLSLMSPYKISNFQAELYSLVTNNGLTGAYRGFGQSEGSLVTEWTVHMLARALKIDPARFRLKNLLRSEDMPYTSPLGAVYDSGDYTSCLEKALLLSSYDKLKEEANAARRMGIAQGVGISFYVSTSGIGPSRFMGANYNLGGYESIRLRVEPDGRIIVHSGLLPHGQGTATILAQVCADELGLDIHQINVVFGDTELTPYGHGTWGSRGAVMASATTHLACQKLLSKMRMIAAQMMQCSGDAVEHVNGRFRNRLDSSKEVLWHEVASAAWKAHRLPENMEPGLEVTVRYDPPALNISYGVHVATVEVDRETGMVKQVKHYVVTDSGLVINPMLIEGQIHGGVAQGVGTVISEEFIYSDGYPQTANFIYYNIPLSEEMPSIECSFMETPAPNHPMGVKGIGEGPLIGSPASIVNAIIDALDKEICSVPASYSQILSILR